MNNILRYSSSRLSPIELYSVNYVHSLWTSGTEIWGFWLRNICQWPSSPSFIYDSLGNRGELQIQIFYKSCRFRHLLSFPLYLSRPYSRCWSVVIFDGQVSAMPHALRGWCPSNSFKVIRVRYSLRALTTVAPLLCPFSLLRPLFFLSLCMKIVRKSQSPFKRLSSAFVQGECLELGTTERSVPCDGAHQFGKPETGRPYFLLGKVVLTWEITTCCVTSIPAYRDAPCNETNRRYFEFKRL